MKARRPRFRQNSQRKPNPRAALVRGLAALFAQAVGLVVVASLVLMWLPAKFNPFLPLRPSDDIGPLTRWKLQAFALDPQSCRTFLRAANVNFVDVADRSEQGFCRMKDGVRLISGTPPFAPNSPIMTCPVAAGLIIWERHSLRQLARETMGSPLKNIRHIGTYNCRRQYGRATGPISEHASANAIDIAGFEFANGAKITLIRDWRDTEEATTPEGTFLRQAQNSACDIFKVVLGPKSNAAHKDHFHFDMGPMLSCR